ncbi:MAG: hypothetical protein ING75_15265 [Rhodocyclaceae bacterium]|nr:hypothetical protein [Rhodocyclaceae bacterium]
MKVLGDEKTRQRLLGAFLAITVLLALIPLKQAPNSHEAVAESGGASPNVPVDTNTTPPVQPKVARPVADPFASRSWGGAQPIPPNTPAPNPQSSTQPPVAAVAPLREATVSLPYRFAGRFVDDGDVTIYLLRGDEVAVAKTDATLDGQWRVRKIEPSQIEFVHVHTGRVIPLLTNSKLD